MDILKLQSQEGIAVEEISIFYFSMNMPLWSPNYNHFLFEIPTHLEFDCFICPPSTLQHFFVCVHAATVDMSQVKYVGICSTAHKQV